MPLVEAEGGQVYLVSADATRVSVHLAGHLSGAPGNALFCRRILEPALRTVNPEAEIVLSSGCQIPAGAVLMGRPGRSGEAEKDSG